MVSVLRIGELRTITVSVSNSVKPLFWALVIFSMLTFLIGVYITDAVTSYKVNVDATADTSSESSLQLQAYYGSLDRSMLAIYETMTEGVHWSEIMNPLVECISPWFIVLFVVYISFTLFVLLNVVTSVFVGSALSHAEEDQKLMVAAQLREAFIASDADTSGDISWDEFRACLKRPDVALILKALELDPEDAKTLFILLDDDQSGTIDSKELVHGFLRLQGHVKALDFVAYPRDYKTLNQQSWSHRPLHFVK